MKSDLSRDQRKDETFAEDEYEYDDNSGKGEVFDFVDHCEAEKKESQGAERVCERGQYGFEERRQFLTERNVGKDADERHENDGIRNDRPEGGL